MGAAGGVERFEDLHDLPVRLLQGPSVDSARLWSKTSSEAPEGPLVSDRHDRPTTPAEKGDQLSAERELTCPPTGILGCPRSPGESALKPCGEGCQKLASVMPLWSRRKAAH